MLNARKRKLTYNQRRKHLRPQVMGNLGNCPHSLAAHQEVMGDIVTYALPCVIKQHKAKTPVHKDSTGRKWQ